MITGGLALLILGAVTLWLARPRREQEWAGEDAAVAAAAVIFMAAALGDLWTHLVAAHQASTLLTSLAWFAALPLLACIAAVRAAQAIGMPWHWDRMIWGRILLGVCVVFELARRSDMTHIIAPASLVILILGLTLSALRPALSLGAAAAAVLMTLFSVVFVWISPDLQSGYSAIWLAAFCGAFALSQYHLRKS